MEFPLRRLVTGQDTCYHCPFAHPGLCEALDINEYHSVCYEHNSFQFSPLAPPNERPEEGGEWDTITANRIEGALISTPCCQFVMHQDVMLAGCIGVCKCASCGKCGYSGVSKQ